jgi:hypothetical protein
MPGMNGIRGLAAGAIAAGSLALASAAHAEVLASWNFNAWEPARDLLASPDRGSGLLDLSAVSTGLAAFAGTTANSIEGDPAGFAMSIVGQSHNGGVIHLYAPTGGFEHFSVSFAARRTASGFASNRVELWDGAAWLALGGFAAGSDWVVEAFEFSQPSSAPPQELVLRFTLGGATTSSGNLRIDNLRVEGRAVPAPGALALLGLGAMAARRRRR